MFRDKRAATSKHSAVLHTRGSDAWLVGDVGEVYKHLLSVATELAPTLFAFETFIANSTPNAMQVKRSIPHKPKRLNSACFRLA